MNIKDIKVIAFDADDTLWLNETYYKEAEKLFCKLLENYLPEEKVSEELYKTEVNNMQLYGYGAKAFTLSIIETALRISNMNISGEIIYSLLQNGKTLIDKPIELLEDIEYLLLNLKSRYTLVLATKGDLLDQQRKLNNSGLLQYFHHVEIMHDKNKAEYQKLINRLNIKAEEFLMVGNSLKSDILPVLDIGGLGVYIPFHTTWQHETIENDSSSNTYYTINKLIELLDILSLNNV